MAPPSQSITPAALAKARKRAAEIRKALPALGPRQRAELQAELVRHEDTIARFANQPTSKDRSAEAARKKAAAEAARLEKEAANLRARAKAEKAKGSGFDVEYARGAKDLEAKAAAARKRAGITDKPLVTPKGPSGPAPAAATAADGAAAIAKVNQLRAKPAGPPPGGPVASSTRPSGGGGGIAAGGLAAGTGGSTAGVTAGKGVSAGEVDAEFSKRFAHMQWAWGHPELGPVLREAAEKGYNENELTGRLFQTEWFKVHGTANAVAQLRDTADDYLVKLTDDVARRYAMQLISKEVQPAEVAQWVKEQAKSRYPTLAGAIDRGVTVRQYADAYVNDAAATLELSPEAIDLSDPKWGRPLEGNADPKTGERAAMTRYDWITMLKSDPAYAPMYDRTTRARTEAAQFASQLRRMFGAEA